jgi:GAF domain-containing protein/CheY-like chemotaxis protein
MDMADSPGEVPAPNAPTHARDGSAAERWLAAVAEALGGAVAVVDETLTVRHWSPGMERLTGLGAETVLGRPLVGLSPLVDALDLAERLRDRPAGGSVAATGAAGSRVEVHWIPLEGGEVPRTTAVVLRPTDTGEGAIVDAMQAVGRRLASSLDLDQVLDTIVTQAREVMGADAALVVAGDGDAPAVRVLRATGRLSAHYAASGVIPLGGGPISRAIRERRLVATPDLLADPACWLAPERRAQVEREGFKAVAAAPLVSGGRVHGALVVHYWAVRHLTAPERAALTLLAEQAAMALEHARLYRDATRRAARLRELAEIERLLASSLDLDAVLGGLADATARLLGAPVVHLWTAEPEARRLRLRAASVAPGLPEVGMPATLAFGEGITGRAAARREPVFVPDAERDPRVLIRGWGREAGLGTILAVPILLGERVLGVLTIRAPAGRLSPEEDQPLAVSLAGRAALAIQNARAYTEVVERAARLRALAAVGQSVSASLDTSDIMQRIVEAAATLSPGGMAAVHALDAERGVLRFAAVSSAGWVGLPEEFPATAGLPGLVLEERRPVLVADPASHPRTLVPDWWRARRPASFYGVPITAGDEPAGVLSYAHPGGVPDPEQQEVLRLLAAHAGVAIRNAALYQAERTQAARVSALAAINQRMSRALNLDELLRLIAESAADLTGARCALFWTADEARRVLEIQSASVAGMAEDYPEPVASYDVGAVGWIARYRVPLLVDDVFRDDRIAHPAWWRRWGLRALAGYPVMAGDELLAVLLLCHTVPLRFSDEIRHVVDMFIAQASVALQNARLFRETQRRREVAEALARLGRELTATLDVEPVAELVARRSAELLNGRAATVYRYEPADGTLHTVAAWGETPGRPGMVLGAGEGVAGRAVAERALVATADVLTDPAVRLSAELRTRTEQEACRAVVAVPLIARDHVVGALAVGAEPGRIFGPDDRRALQAFADQAALAFENARLYASARDSLARLRETQAQLVQAAKLSALGQLVSGVAHELNNPLSVVIGYGQLLLKRELPEPVRQPLELMVQQGDRMAKIVRNLLYFARQRPPERAPLDLHRVIEETLALRLHQLALSGITVERDFAPALPLVSADSQQLQQVFLNLLLNAEQAIGPGRSDGRIVFRTRVVDGGRTVRVEVMDNGPGIPAEILPRIFEPFFTTKEVGSGSGLGLSVSYGIVQEHGGRLTAESEPGRTVFILELPVGEGGGTEAAAPPRVPRSHRAPAALVVEDEPSVAELIRTLLRQAGWGVDVAPGGRDGLRRLRERRYDLVVSDLRMADGDGETFYREARALDPEVARRLLFITGDTANPRVLDFLRQVGLPVLEKPFSTDVFLETVHRVAALAGAEAPGHGPSA